MTVDEMDLRDTARALAWLYLLLDDRKFAPPPPKDSRIMRPTPGPADPVPLWLVDAEDRLLEERKEVDENGYPLPAGKVVPGGLRTMIVDAAEHIDTHPEKRDGASLCDFVGWNSHLIALDFPAAADLLDLMKQQANWLAARLTPSQQAPDVQDPFLTMGSLLKTLTNRGLECPAGTIRRWASEGHVAVSVRDDRRRTYRLDDVITQLGKRDPC